jgi:hypothetical protein
MSAIGTKRTRRTRGLMSAYRGEPDATRTWSRRRLMTQSGHSGSVGNVRRCRGRWLRKNWTTISVFRSLRGSKKPMSTSRTSCTSYLRHRKYGAIYADPPWSFRNWSARGTGRNAVSHYDCLDFRTLASLPVADLAADDCALFLWATDPLLPRALELIQAWGFEYRLSDSTG